VGLLGIVSRWAVFTGLLVAVGAVVFRMWVLRTGDSPSVEAGDESPDPSAAAPASLAGRFAALGSVLLVLGALGRLATELAVFRDPFEPWAAELSLLVTGTSFGSSWTAQLVLGLAACLAFAIAARSSRRGRATASWGLAILVTVGLAFTPAFSGHAAGSQHLRSLAITSDVLHVLAGGTWLGTLAVITWVAARSRATGFPIARERLVEWVARFSPVALLSATALAVTGAFASWLHLDAVASLWQSAYGQRLLIKVGVLSVIVGFGAYNWKQSRGKIAVSGEPGRLPSSVASELAAGLAILLVTAMLVTTPPPGE